MLNKKEKMLVKEYAKKLVNERSLNEDKKTWMDFMSHNDRMKLPKSILQMTEKQIQDLMAQKIAKRDSSVTSRSNKLILRDEVWTLQAMLDAYEKARNANAV